MQTIEAIVKTIYYPMIILSIIGLFVCVYRKDRLLLPFLVIITWAILWRIPYKYSASRYFCIFILYSISLSSKLIYDLSHLKIPKKQYVILGLLLFVAIFHIVKSFSSFKNDYVLDLLNIAEEINKSSSENILYVYNNESMRVSSFNLINKNYGDSELVMVDCDTKTMTFFYDSNSFFGKNLYFFLPEKNEKTNDSLHQFNNRPCKRIGSFLSNKNHTKCVSVYRHFPYFPSPDIDFDFVASDYSLKAFIREYDTYIYQHNNKIVWVIGSPIDNNTEIIFHLITDRPDLLPPKYAKYGFENSNFRCRSGFEVEPQGRYRVFERNIPNSYPIKIVLCGFKTNGKLSLARKFSISSNTF